MHWLLHQVSKQARSGAGLQPIGTAACLGRCGEVVVGSYKNKVKNMPKVTLFSNCTNSQGMEKSCNLGRHCFAVLQDPG